MRNKLLALAMIVVLLFALAACGGNKEGSAPATDGAADLTDYDAALAAARGTTVTFYGWGGDEDLNNWIDTELAPALLANYEITLTRVPMNIDDILAQLSGEKQANTEAGSIDMIWINGENFYTAKENGLLYGPFTDVLPNYAAYVDSADEETLNDFCYPIEGYEAPYSKAQIILINDSAVTPEAPANAEEFLAFCQQYPGKVTYAAPPDFTGSAFVRNIIYELCGYEQFLTMAADKETVRAAVAPAMEYLRSLNPYLWNQGKTFPADSTQISNMFIDGELVLNISYDAYDVGMNIKTGAYTGTTRAFQFDKGTIGNTNYVAIAMNAPNKAGALVAINEILSPQQQAAKYQVAAYMPAISFDKMTDAEKALFDGADFSTGNVAQDEMLAKRLPEMPAALVPIIEEIWLEEVVGK